MKFVLAILAFVAVTGLCQAHKLPDFGKGPLHEDIQDLIDLVPDKKIEEIAVDYLQNDPEVKIAAKYLSTSSTIKDLTVGFESIPEVINLLNYLQREGIDIYTIMNMINKALGIKEIVPPDFYFVTTQRTGGIKGFFQDTIRQFNYDDIIAIYVRKMKTSPAFGNLVKQFRSDNFQQIVYKVYALEPFKFILNAMESSGVNTRIVGDILYILFEINVPERTAILM